VRTLILGLLDFPDQPCGAPEVAVTEVIGGDLGAGGLIRGR